MFVPLIAQRLKEHYSPSGQGKSPARIESHLATLRPDGSWPDLDAMVRPEQAGMMRAGHFGRILELVESFALETNGSRRAVVSEAIHRALGLWLGQVAPLAPNWRRQIGVPKTVARIAMLFQDELSPAERGHILEILRTCVRPDGTLDYAGEPATGANLADEVEVQIVAGILENDADSIDRYVRDLERAIRPGTVESVQVDWSFHQHGTMLYSGGYGVGFIGDAALKAWMLRETPFAFSSQTLETLCNYTLEGLGRMTRGKSFDFSTVGRQIARPNLGSPNQGTARACEYLAIAYPQRRAELVALARQLRGETQPELAPPASRVFWRSDYVTHQRPGFFASARLSSRRVQGTESGNGENEQGYHLGDGAMCLMVSGDEYRNIFPLWNWRRVPGVSCIDNPDVPFPRHTWGRGSQGFSDFAGGVSDGKTAVAALELHRGGLYAKKAWFFLDDVVVCLGAGLLPDDPTQSVVTTIEQRWTQGAITSSKSEVPLSIGDTVLLSESGWINHDDVTYLFPRGGSVVVSNQHTVASWKAISTSIERTMTDANGHSTNRVEGDVFSLWFDHGNQVAHPTEYAYIIAPHLAPAQIPGFTRSKMPNILLNTSDQQVVLTATSVNCIFWRAGKLDLPDGRRIEVDKPCLLQWKKVALKRTLLAVSDATQRLEKVRVTLHGPSSSPHAMTMDLPLPMGEYAGQPVLRELSSTFE